VLLPTLLAGDVEFTNALANVATDEVDRRGRYDAILGIDRFSSFRVTIDIPSRRLILQQPAEGESQPSQETAEATGGKRPPDDGRVVDLWRIEGQLLVTIGMNGGVGHLMMIDTGASRTVLGLGAAERLEGIQRSERTAPTHGFGGEVAGTENIRGLDLLFAGEEWRDLSVIGVDLSRRSRLSGTEVAGYLGLDVLRHLTLTFEPGLTRVRVAR
jgi:hypothetical protein